MKRTERHRGVRCLPWLLPLLLAASPAIPAEVDERVPRLVLEHVQEAREAAGIPSLIRRSDLDAVALARAKEIAALPHKKRLALGKPIGPDLRAAGIDWFHAPSVHIDMVRGYTHPETGLVGSWKRYEQAWNKALDPRLEAVGAASHGADDGWVIFVAVFLDELEIPRDLPSLEKLALEAVNEVRREHGLVELKPNGALRKAARGHSKDMAKRDYLEHESPEGKIHEDRVRARGVRYELLAENILSIRGAEDPIVDAVESWMSSAGHRENILEPEYRETGIGIAVRDDGTLYFTQLFMKAPAGSSR